MRLLLEMGALAALAAALAAPASAEEAFDACRVFTQADAEKALGGAATGESANPKAKRPKVVTACAYSGVKDGKPVEARAQFRFARNEADAQREFEEARMQYQTKPLRIAGADATFWSGKTGQMNVRKGRAWIIVSVGVPKAVDREMDPSRALAEVLLRKL